MKIKTFAITFILATCLMMTAVAAQDMPVVSMKAHLELELSCADCHGVDEPAKRPKKADCVACHDDGSGTYIGTETHIENYPQRKVKVHSSHYGENIRCTKCHSYHNEPVLACNECHDYELKVK